MAPYSFLKAEKTSPNSMLDGTPSSRFHPSRLLRRKASVNARGTSSNVDSDSLTGPTTGSTTSSVAEQVQQFSSTFDYARRGSDPVSGPWGDGTVVIDAGIPPTSPPSRPLTPSSPIYPTALSPPLRPMSRSPRTQQSPVLQSPPSPHGSSIMESLSAVHRASTPVDPPSPTQPIGSTEWLRRKPSSTGRTRKDHPTIASQKILDRPAAFRTSSTDAESSSASSDGEFDVGIAASRRRSTSGEGTYEVEVVCLDRRETSDELRWEVSIRYRREHNEAMNGTPASPLQLSTSSSIAQAPSSASSINLSLSLDQPTGKLVFIAFPTDIHATPTRRRPREKDSPRPCTPPRASTPPHAPDLGGPPTTPNSQTKGATSMWPSPSKNRIGRSKSPTSPRDMFTPRRTRIVSATQLDGGLYAKGTVNGMSEELEKELSLDEELEQM